jgi:hypothetical protein
MTGYLSIRTTNADTPIQQHEQSHLFTLRLWSEEGTDGHSEWRGKIQHVMSGEAHYFREWQALVQFLLVMLPGSQPNGQQDAYAADGQKKTPPPLEGGSIEQRKETEDDV